MHDQGSRPRRGALRTLTLAVAGIVAMMVPAAGHAATRGFTTTSFDSLRVEAPVTVIVTTGKGASARADGDA
ncbi:MAG: DUF2807 domain-containing protein, partial [bacterium]|nr:DUF2807 domain-containing protein [bacterium]